MPSPTGGPVNKIGIDTAGFDADAEKLLRKINLLSAGMKALAVASLNYNEAGKITDAVIRGLTEKGTQIDIFLKKVTGGWDVAAKSTKQSIDRIIRDQERLKKEQADAKQAAKNAANTAVFRQKLGGFSRSEIPTAASQVDQRFFINAQRDLEKFVAAGDISAKRAATILDNIKSGVKGRLQGIEEDFRVAALRMFSAAQRVRQQFNDAVVKQQAVSDARTVRPYLDSVLGKINTAATPAGLGRVENLFNRLAVSVESTSVPLTRFQDLVTRALGGVADPANKAERSIVRMVQSLVGEYDKATKAAQKVADAQKRIADAANVRNFVTSQIGRGLGGLSGLDQERVQAQIARIQSLMTRASNPLSVSGFQNAVGAGLKGQTIGFQGVEEQARKAGARIRQIISGQLKDPFNIHLAIDRNTALIKNLYTGRFLIDLVQDFHKTVEAAAEYQRSIALIQTITDDVKVPFDRWADSIRRVSDELGKPIAEVAAAGYDVLSNQVTKNVEDTVAVLRSAGQFARVTNSSTEDSINLVSSAVNTFKLQAGDADRVFAQFFKTIDLGRVKTDEMANTIGRSAVYAKTLGVSLEELQAGIVTITQTGQKADSSFTLLNNVFQKLLNPTKELQAYYDKLGVGTGEIFVQTFGGLAGALKKINEETGASKTKLADFFNEIRAFGGIDALISRSRVFEGALKDIGNSAKTFEDAKKKFDELPGQRFAEEMTKIKNLFLSTFQTSILQTILKITDTFGGLAASVKGVTIATTSLGVALGVAWGINKVVAYWNSLKQVEGTTVLLTNRQVALGLAGQAAWGAIALAVTAVVALLVKAHEDSVNFYNELAEAAQEAADKQIEANEKAASASRAAYADALRVEKGRILTSLSLYVQAGQERVAIEEKVYKRIGESAQNAFENAYGTARTLLDGLKNKQREALKIADDFRTKGKADIIDDYSKSVFRNKLRRNDALNGGNAVAERQIYQKRLNDVTKLINAAAKRGDLETARKYLEERGSILQEMADKTVHNRFTGQTHIKYSGADDALLRHAKDRLRVEQQIANLKQAEGLRLQATINKEADNLKALEDAYKEVYDFKPDAKKGPAANLEEYDKKVAEAKALTQDFLKRSGTADNGLARDLFNRQADLSFGRGGDLRASLARKFREQADLDSAKKAEQEAVNKLGDDAQERFDLLKKQETEAKNRLAQTQGRLTTDTGNLFERTVFEPQLQRTIFGAANPEKPNRLLYDENAINREALQQGIKKSLAGGDYETALKKLQELRELFKEVGALKTKIYGEDGKSITVDNSLKVIEQRVREQRLASRQVAEAEKAVKDAESQQQGNANSIKSIQERLQQLGPTSDEIVKKLIADQAAYRGSLAKTIADLDKIILKRQAVGPNVADTAEREYDQKAGLPVPYTTESGEQIGSGRAVGKAQGGYIFPGGPSGTDTVPAWLTEGEYVMPEDKTKKYRHVLERMRAGNFAEPRHTEDGFVNRHRGNEYRGGGVVHLTDGGLVGDFTAQLKALNSGFGFDGSLGAGGDTTHVGDINITVNGGDTGRATVQEIGKELDRAIRRRAIKLRTN